MMKRCSSRRDEAVYTVHDLSRHALSTWHELLLPSCRLRRRRPVCYLAAAHRAGGTAKKNRSTILFRTPRGVINERHYLSEPGAPATAIATRIAR